MSLLFADYYLTRPFVNICAFISLCLLWSQCLDRSIIRRYTEDYDSQTARSIMLAATFHSAVALACSLLIFPETVNAQFAKRLKSILVLLEQAIKQQPSLLKNGLSGIDESLKAFDNLITKAESGLGPLTGSGRLMKQDVSWGRFAAIDLLKFQQLAQSLTV